jgi:aspartyl-tRNA(Asn)/glutamyl-tRNA(Gln) amidotransferase subunit A
MLLAKSLLNLKQLIIEKKASASEIYQYFQKRIKKYNSCLNAFLTLDRERVVNKGELLGLPVAIKDNFCTLGLKTTAASKVLADFIPPYESTVTARLKKQGANFLGKTNMDAWAHGSSTETSDYGPTKNPWDLTRSPGGSSGGTACAVSAYLAPAGIGSETAGSIRQPAAWSGIVGLKPTYGRVSRYGVIAMGSSLDCPGPMTLTVEDAAYLLKLIAGKDPYDATSSSEPVPDYQSLMKTPRKMRIGICEDYFQGLDQGVEKRINIALEIFKRLGHNLKKIKLLSPKYSISVYTIIQRAEVSSNLARYDGIRYGNDRRFFGKKQKDELCWELIPYLMVIMMHFIKKHKRYVL